MVAFIKEILAQYLCLSFPQWLTRLMVNDYKRRFVHMRVYTITKCRLQTAYI